MPSTAPLRLVVSRAETPDVFQRLAAARPAPPEAEAPDRVMPATALASFAIHAAVLLWMAIHGVLGEERAAGAGEDLVLAEGIPVMLIEAAPMPEVPPIEATEVEAEAEEAPPPEPVEMPSEPMPETTRDPALPEPLAEPMPATAPETLPPPDAETSELAARPEHAVTMTESETTDAGPFEDEPPPPAPDAVPAPRLKPERTEVATAEPPHQEPEPETREEPPQQQPAAPPPSAPSAASTAARSDGAGGGGASQAAGNAAAAAYRAKVAAQLKRRRFYPNAARRDRLTGTATVSFTLNGAGNVTAVRVVRSSGQPILDQAAIEMVQRASPFPPIPAGLGNAITIQAPIGFELPR